MPAHSTGIGKAILAHLAPEEDLEHGLPEQLEPRTPTTITSRDQTGRGTCATSGRAATRRTTIENEDGIRCVGAPIFDHTGRVCAGLSIAGPASTGHCRPASRSLGRARPGGRRRDLGADRATVRRGQPAMRSWRGACVPDARTDPKAIVRELVDAYNAKSVGSPRWRSTTRTARCGARSTGRGRRPRDDRRRPSGGSSRAFPEERMSIESRRRRDPRRSRVPEHRPRLEAGRELRFTEVYEVRDGRIAVLPRVHRPGGATGLSWAHPVVAPSQRGEQEDERREVQPEGNDEDSCGRVARGASAERGGGER